MPLGTFAPDAHSVYILLGNTLGVFMGFLLWKLSDNVLPHGLRQLHCTDMESEIV